MKIIVPSLALKLLLMFQMRNSYFIFTIFVTIFLGLSVRADDCVLAVNKILKADADIAEKEIHIPKKFRLDNTPDESAIFKISKDMGRDTYQEARDNFLKSIAKKNDDGDRLIDLLEKLQKKDFVKDLKHSHKEKDELLANLKAVRKQAIILRSVFEVYSEGHQVPEQFEKFTKKLGKLNDYLDFDAWKTIPDGAQVTAKNFKLEEIKDELAGFVASTPRATRQHLEKLKKEIYLLVSKDNLTVDEFHETRKLLKHFLAVSQLEKNTPENQELHRSFKFLEEMNEILGSLRDDVLEEEVMALNIGKTLEDEEYQHIPENLKKEILIFIKTFKIELVP